MALLVLLGSGFFLASVAMLDQTILQLVLMLLFVSAGFLVRYRLFTAYLVFIFLYPLLPSQFQYLFKLDLVEFLFLSLAFWWAFQRIRSQRWRLPDHPLNPLLSLFLLVSAISVVLALISGHFVLSEVFLLKLKDNWNIFRVNPYSDLAPLHSLIYMMEGMLFFYITIDALDTSEKIQRAARIIFYSAVLVSVLGILQYAFRFQLLEYWIKVNPKIVRINSTFSDPNSLATYLATIVCFAAFAYCSSPVERGRPVHNAGGTPAFHRFSKEALLHIVLVAVVFLALVFTVSRAGIGAAFLALFLLPALLRWAGIDGSKYLRGPTAWLVKRGAYVLMSGFVLLVFTAFVINYQNPKPVSLFQVVMYTFNPQITFDRMLQGRITFWKAAIDLFRDYPVFGCGAGAFTNALRNAPYFQTQPENAHNYFLQILSEIGLPGLILFCAILIQILRYAIKKLRASDVLDFPLIFGLFAGLIAFLLTCFTGHPLLLLKLQFVFWGFIGPLVIQPGSTQPVPRFSWGTRIFICTIILVAAFQIRSTLQSRRIPVYEHGYHEWEKDQEGNNFRWTGRAAISKMEVRGAVLSISLRQLNPEAVKKSAAVKIFVNNELVDNLHLSSFEWKEFKYYLPHLMKGKYAVLRIEPEIWFVPDKRELGIAVGNLAWMCSLSDPIGVHELEQEGTESLYWTRGQASFPLQISGEMISFQLLANPSVEKEPVEALFYWNDTSIKRMILTRAQWQNVSVGIPEGEREGIFTIRVLRTANPKRMRLGADARDLGVRLSWPLQSGGKPVILQENPTGLLTHAEIYGISNNRNHPFQLVSYPIQSSSSKMQIRSCGVVLRPEPALLDSVSPREGNWIRIFPKSGAPKHVNVSIHVIKNVHLPPGPVVIRMTAMGNIAAGEVPVASLRINDREVARQPVPYEDWKDYYFSVLWPKKGKRLTLEFVNDYYEARQWMDRNLIIKEIVAAAAKQEPRELKPGWQLLPGWVLLAEPVGMNLPFSPLDNCYSISSK